MKEPDDDELDSLLARLGDDGEGAGDEAYVDAAVSEVLGRLARDDAERIDAAIDGALEDWFAAPALEVPVSMPGDDERIDRAVRGAPQKTGRQPSKPTRARAPGWAAAAVALLALAVGGGTALARIGLDGLAAWWADVGTTASTEPASGSDAPTSRAEAEAPSEESTEPSVEPWVELEGVPLEGVQTAPSVERPENTAPRTTRRAPRETTPARDRVETAPVVDAPSVVPSVEPEPPPALGPDALLRSANDARAAGDWREAVRRYEALQRAFPSSSEASVSRVSAGRLLAARGEAAAALRQFEAYLAAAPSGALAEEARVGRARALGSLGRTDAEREAWREILVRHPESPAASLARGRLRD